MRLAVEQVGADVVVRALRDATRDIPKQMAQVAYAVGAKAVEEIKRLELDTAWGEERSGISEWDVSL